MAKLSQKKQQIFDAALLLFVEQGFYATSTASIAKQAQVATGTLFHHFSSKDKLIEQLYLSIKQEFANHVVQIRQQAPNLTLQQLAQQIWFGAIEWAMENPLKQRFFQQYSQSATINKAIKQQALASVYQLLEPLLVQGQQQSLVADYPMDLMLETCHGQFLTLSHFYIEQPHLWQNERYKQASFQLFWQAISPR